MQNADIIAPKEEPIERKKEKKLDQRVIICSVCSFQTNRKGLLAQHMKTHKQTSPRSYKCVHCSRVFRDLSQLTNHENVHTGLKPHQCDGCEMCFTTRGELMRHTRYKHSLERPHKCASCDYSTVELSKLRRHQRTHTDERPYLCPYCDYASVDTFKLKRHIRIHTGEKPYVCPVCKMSFSQSNSLKGHMTIHEEGKVLRNSKFRPKDFQPKPLDDFLHSRQLAAAELLENELISTSMTAGLKLLKSDLSEDYSSDLIAQSGSSAIVELISTLSSNSTETTENSQNTQTSETIWYSCKDCDMKFSMFDLLEEHSVRHNGNRPFQCDVCGLSFGLRFAMRAHMTSHNRRKSVENEIINADDTTTSTNLKAPVKKGRGRKRKRSNSDHPPSEPNSYTD